jgi:hypothetical protein
MKHLIWLLPFSILNACGGGGGGDDDKNPDSGGGSGDGGGGSGDESGGSGGETVVQRASLTGLAVKGLAQNAKVSAFTQSGGSFKDTADVVGLTDKNGRYTLLLPEALSTYKGPLKIELSYNNTESKLQCDDTAGCTGGVANGDFYNMPTDFKLASVVNIGSGLTNFNKSTIANITALTTLASNFLERSGNTISENTLKLSNNQVRAVFSIPDSVDIVATQPNNIANDDIDGDAIYGAINAAFLRVANDESTDLTTLIGEYSDQFIAESGQLVLNPVATEPSILEITTAAVALNVLTDASLTSVTETKDDASAATAGDLTAINPPSISAGNDQTANSGDTVTIPVSLIAGAATNRSYVWQVISGPLTLTGNNTATTDELSFSAPAEGGDIKLRVIINSDEGSDNDIVIVSVQPAVSADTNGTGSYKLTTMTRTFFGGDTNLVFRYGLEFQDWDLTFNSSGTGIMSTSEGDTFKQYLSDATLDTPASITLEAREYESSIVTIDNSINLEFTQLATNSLQLNIPLMIDDDQVVAGNGFIDVNEGKSLIFYNLGEGLYAGFDFFTAKEYQVTNYVQEANDASKDMGFDFLTLNKKNSAMTNFSGFANKAYNFIELRTTLQANKFEMMTTKGTLVFDATASKFDVEETRQKIVGIPNTNQAGGTNGSYTLVEEIKPSETIPTAGFNIANGRWGLGYDSANPTAPNLDDGNIVSNAVASDYSALTSSSYSFENSTGTDYIAGTPSVAELASSVYIEKASSVIDLEDKIYRVSFINYIVENNNPASPTPIAPEVIVEKYVGAITVTDGDVKLDMQLVQGKLIYPSGTVETSPGILDVELTYDTEPEEASGVYGLDSMSTDAQGCIKATAPNNFEFCVSDNGTLVGWNYGTEIDGTSYSSHSVNMIFGEETTNYTDTSLKFKKVDIADKAATLTFSNGNATYNFVADGSGDVTFSGSTLEAIEWNIDARGRLIIFLDNSGDIHRYTLTSGTEASGTITQEIDFDQNDENFQLIGDAVDLVWSTTSNP